MTTTYDRMRRAAHLIQSGCIADSPADELAQHLRADADRLEALEKEMRNAQIFNKGSLHKWADRIRGEVK